MPNFYQYFSNKDSVKVLPNQWDGIALALVLGIIAVLAWGAKQMSAPFQLGQTLHITLDPSILPQYGLLTVMRMLIALFFSLLFTLTIGTWAAKSQRAGRILIPCIDVLQSVPVIGLLSITMTTFIALFPGNRLGPECASIFTVFVSQVWNMTLSFYQSLRTVPHDLREAADMFHLSSWQRFWRIEVPFAMPGLLWNMMLSMSASWFFVVISESISVANQHVNLPGIGSYLGFAISQANIHAVVYAIAAMLVVIFLYDQLMFRPLLAWAEKFKAEYTAQEKNPTSWMITLLRRTRALQQLGEVFKNLIDKIVNVKYLRHSVHQQHAKPTHPLVAHLIAILGYALLSLSVIAALYFLYIFIFTAVPTYELPHVLLLGLITALRVFVIVLVSTLIWLPIGVWIGLHPRLAEITQPVAQFLAAFPANVLFPLVVVLIITYHLNVNVWTTPLMLLGTQWYILFNVIAGTMALPKDLKQVADNFDVKGWRWWQRLILPGIFPYYITGAITAAGNAWNTSVVAEIVSWGSITLTADGLGAYITRYSNIGDFPRVALGISVMCLFVLTMNRLVWRPLYNLAQAKFRLE